MRHLKHRRIQQKTRKLKRVIKNHPIQSIGALTLGVGLLSGMYVLLRKKFD